MSALAVGVLLLGIRAAAHVCFDSPHGPNIVLITIDTVRADHLGSYGYDRQTPPEIDALAQDGVLFYSAHAPSNWTLPSMTTVHTGLYPSEHGAVVAAHRFPANCVTLAAHLRDAGYRTIGLVSHYFVSRKYGFAESFEIFDQTHISGHESVTSESISDLAIRILRSTADHPFFLWVHYFDPHYTYVHHQEYGFGAGYMGRLPDRLAYDAIDAVRDSLLPADIQYVRDIYD